MFAVQGTSLKRQAQKCNSSLLDPGPSGKLLSKQGRRQIHDRLRLKHQRRWSHHEASAGNDLSSLHNVSAVPRKFSPAGLLGCPGTEGLVQARDSAASPRVSSRSVCQSPYARVEC